MIMLSHIRYNFVEKMRNRAFWDVGGASLLRIAITKEAKWSRLTRICQYVSKLQIRKASLMKIICIMPTAADCKSRKKRFLLWSGGHNDCLSNITPFQMSLVMMYNYRPQWLSMSSIVSLYKRTTYHISSHTNI